MKRYFCTAAAGLLLALGASGTASASGLPVVGGIQEATQSVSFGDQTVGEQKNDADITQEQGNDNLNIAPAIGILGDAETKNAQGNGNTATADVDQSNSVDQSQSAYQRQTLDQSGSDGCCDNVSSQTGAQQIDGGTQYLDKQENDADVAQEQGNGNVNIAPAIAIFGDAETENAQGNDNTATADVEQSNSADQYQSSYQRQSLEQSGGRGKESCCSGRDQSGEQRVYGGDQAVDEQKNDADVTQKQGNGNVNIAPAVAIFGDAKTESYQGNHNDADADVEQSNSATQSQSATQKQDLSQERSDCCKPKDGDKPKHDDCKKDDCKKDACCDGQSQTGEQKTSFGDQSVGKQRNDADVTQKQGNGNVNFSPAIGIGGKKHDGCRSKCDRMGHGGHSGSDASTWNAQGNDNTATADVEQSNSVGQSQRAYQYQRVVDACKGVMSR